MDNNPADSRIKRTILPHASNPVMRRHPRFGREHARHGGDVGGRQLAVLDDVLRRDWLPDHADVHSQCDVTGRHQHEPIREDLPGTSLPPDIYVT